MTRRQLLLLFGGAAIAWPFAVPLATIAHAQKQPRISILHSGFPNRTPIHLLVDAVPGTKRVAVLWSPTHPETAAFLDNIRRSGLARGIEIYARELRETLEDLPAAFADARREGAQAVIFMGSNLMFGHRKEIA